MPPALRTTVVDCGAVTLCLHRAGQGAPVLLLHGFPELARFWWPLMRALADDFDTLAPDQRGCGDSARAANPDDYSVPALLGDLLALLDALALPSCHLVGHDWGGVLAWWFAARHPQRVRRLAVFNAPHPVALQTRLLADARQQAASAYLARLQQPGAAARLLEDGADALWQRLRGSAAAGFDDDDRRAYVQAWSAGLEGAVAWYRASPFVPGPVAATVDWHVRERLPVTVPTLIGWGLADASFVPELVDDSAAFARDVRVQRFATCGHNLPRERPLACAALLRDFFSEART